jgi:hypothetical protein
MPTSEENARAAVPNAAQFHDLLNASTCIEAITALAES